MMWVSKPTLPTKVCQAAPPGPDAARPRRLQPNLPAKKIALAPAAMCFVPYSQFLAFQNFKPFMAMRL